MEKKIRQISEWVKQIKEATSHKELDKIQEKWGFKGCDYKASEWPNVWNAFTERRIEIDGGDPYGAPF